jgi:hypothetical protein
MAAGKPGFPSPEEFQIPLDLLRKFETKPRLVIGGSNGGMVLSKQILNKLSMRDLVRLTGEFDVLLVNKTQR